MAARSWGFESSLLGHHLPKALIRQGVEVPFARRGRTQGKQFLSWAPIFRFMCDSAGYKNKYLVLALPRRRLCFASGKQPLGVESAVRGVFVLEIDEDIGAAGEPGDLTLQLLTSANGELDFRSRK